MVQAVKSQYQRENPNGKPLGESEAQSWAQSRVSHIASEISYNKVEYFYNALLYFWGGALLLGLSLAGPQSLWGRICMWGCSTVMVIGEIYAVWGIVVRCLIMERPPITTLYETIIFIATAGVLLGLVAEAVTRKKIGMAVACVAGTAGMLLSIRFMEMEGTDTLQQLQAVLITNFWLATHVPTINLGYAAGMVSAILSMIYFGMRLFQQVQPGDKTAKDITTMGYGFVMVGLFLSLVGTVLGGIWANYSWGRFWGWDPKENGALMIVLMNLVILHARLGGYIREVGFHCCCIVLGMIVAFSWFGVNQLNVGLHTYGFTEGIWFWLTVFWGIQLAIFAYGVALSFMDREARRNRSKEVTAVGQPVPISAATAADRNKTSTPDKHTGQATSA
jgi:ABC-type transport system involved in cytochrome c biogenesis permease subunit